MEEWKLTEKEMQEIIKWVEKIAPLDMQRAERGGCEHTIAKAAQRKLVEWQEKMFNRLISAQSRKDLLESPEWQELRKGVGLDS